MFDDIIKPKLRKLRVSWSVELAQDLKGLKMFDDILPKRKGFYEEMKEKMDEAAKKARKEEEPTVDDYFDDLIEMVKELTEEIEQAELDV